MRVLRTTSFISWLDDIIAPSQHQFPGAAGSASVLDCRLLPEVQQTRVPCYHCCTLVADHTIPGNDPSYKPAHKSYMLLDWQPILLLTVTLTMVLVTTILVT